MSTEFDFDAKVKEADDIEIAEYNFSPTLLENGVIDYSEIQHDKIFLVNKKDILEKARPNWIPELDITGLLEDDFLPTTIKSSDGYYYVQTKKYVGMETNERTRVLEKKFETHIYKMSSDILAATVDYYIKKQRAENKKNGIKKTVSLPRKTKSMLTTRYNNMVELLRFIPEYKDNDELFRKYPNRSKSTAYKNQNTIIFNQYNELLSVLKGKTLDLNLAKQDFINAYAKGEITSYGDTGLSNALYQDYGVKIKKQNGSTFSLEQREKITNALEVVFHYYGNLSNLAKEYGLKISYADNCKQHARKAIGLFTNYHKAIGVSFFDNLNDESLTMAHETAHWLDSLKGKEFSYRMASDKDGTIENKIAEKYKKLIKEENERQKNSTKLGDYWYRTCECFARAIEQDFELTVGLKERCHPPAYLPEEIFNKEIKPLIEELKKENEIKLNLIPEKFVTWTTKIKNKINEQEMSDRERNNLIWLEEVHGCDKEKTAIVLHKLYEKFSELEAFERSKVLPTVFGKLRKQSESFELDFKDSSINAEELDTVLGIYDENITYHTVLDREWAVRHGMSKKEAAHLLEWDYSKTEEHKFIEIINKEELKEQEKENMSDVLDNKIENNEEYANELADWIIQESLECSVNKENYHISFEDIVEKTNTPIEWLNKNYKLVNEALAKHNDNELLEYNPKESNENEFNLYFCSNATENDENTLFKQNKQGRWVRKTEEELEQELKNNTKTIEFDSIFETVSKEFNEKNKDFFNIYEEQKSKQIENLSKNISNLKEKMLFYKIHSEMLKIRVEELKEMVKRCPNKDIALAVGIRYFNYFGNIEGNISHQNLYTRFGIGHFENGQMIYPKPEELNSFIYNLHDNSKKQETYMWIHNEDGSGCLKAPNGKKYFQYDPDADEVKITEDSNWIRSDLLNLGDKTFTQYAEDYVLENNPATYISFETSGKNIEKEQNVDESKQYSFFVKDTAEFEMFEEFETITGLTAKEAISEYKRLREDGVKAGIGINIPSDTTFDDPKGLGTTILVRENGIDAFDIYGDSFIVDLKENNEKSQNRIAAYKELYEELQRAGLNVKEPKFLFEKEKELGLSDNLTNTETVTNEELSILIQRKKEIEVQLQEKENKPLTIQDMDKEQYIPWRMKAHEETEAQATSMWNHMEEQAQNSVIELKNELKEVNNKINVEKQNFVFDKLDAAGIEVESDIPLMPVVSVEEAKKEIIKEEVKLPFSIINNVEKGRVNIKFDQKISDKKFNSILKELKSAGWRFSSFNKQWYPVGKAVEKSESFIRELQEKYSKAEETITYATASFEEFSQTLTESQIQKSPYDGIKFFDRNYKEIDEFVAYFNRNLNVFGKDVEPIDEKIAETIFESLQVDRVGTLNSRTIRLGLDASDNLVLLNKEKNEIETKQISLKELFSLARETLEKSKEELDKSINNLYQNDNKEQLVNILENLFQTAKRNNTELINKMDVIYDAYIKEPTQQAKKISKVKPLKIGDSIGDEIVQDVFEMAKGVYQATLMKNINEGPGTYFILDKNIVEKLNPELHQFLEEKEEHAIFETSSRTTPHIIKELIDKNLCPPRDNEYYHQLELHIQKNPLKYEVLYPVTKSNFKNKLKKLYEIDKHINHDVLTMGKQLLSFAIEDDKREISRWLRDDVGCDDEKTLKNVFSNWVSEKEIKQEKKKDGYPPRGE